MPISSIHIGLSGSNVTNKDELEQKVKESNNEKFLQNTWCEVDHELYKIISYYRFSLL